MADPAKIRRERDPWWAVGLVLGAVLVLTLAGTSDHAGSWNDSSRLAMVESLVDEQTFAIDRSIFVSPEILPEKLSQPVKTCDKLWIHGHYYSDKTPVPGLLMAGVYQVWKWATVQTARSCPEGFVWWVTFWSSGLASGVAVWCLFLLGRPLGLGLRDRLLLTGSFGLATLAPIYARQVNNHSLLLAVGAALLLGMAHLARAVQAGRQPRLLLFGLGLLIGLGYTIDQGAGPVLLVTAFALLAYRCRPVSALLLVVAGAVPWLVLHHACNHAIGGTFQPANAVPEYFAWPGCPFDAGHMTGAYNHADVGHLLVYAGQLLIGKRGFLAHDLALWLTLPALVVFVRRRSAELPEILSGLAWFAGTFLLYSLESTNGGGQSRSVRWLVPLLAPAYYVLAVMLRDLPQYRRDFVILSAWGILLTALNWPGGPWDIHAGWYFWPIQALALLSWLASRLAWGQAGSVAPEVAVARLSQPLFAVNDESDCILPLRAVNFTDPQELIKRGWLTSFQANQIRRKG